MIVLRITRSVVGVGVPAEDFEVAVEMDVHLAAVVTGDLDLVVALLVGDLGRRHPTAARVPEGDRLGAVERAACNGLVAAVVVTAAGRPGERGTLVGLDETAVRAAQRAATSVGAAPTARATSG